MTGGIFIAIEGPDGSGKSTLIQNIIPKITDKINQEILVTREPGGNEVSEQIRNIVLGNQNNGKIDAKTEALLFAAARRQHVFSDIIPALDEGKVVISDRYVDSSLAYQGAGRKLGIPEIQTINDFATDQLEPDLIIYLNLPPEIGISRIQQNRSETRNRLDDEKLEFHRLTKEGYDFLSKNKENYYTVDATLDPETLSNQVANKIVDFVNKH